MRCLMAGLMVCVLARVGVGAVEYSSPVVTAAPKGGVTFRGPFDRETLYVTAGGLGESKYVDIAFDLYILRNWGGALQVTTQDQKPQRAGPDYFRLGIRGGATLLFATFSNTEKGSGVGSGSDMQGYPSPVPGDMLPAMTGAVARGTLGYFYPERVQEKLVPMDAVYRVHLVVPRPAGEGVMLEMTGVNVQELKKAGWGVGEVKVTGVAAVKQPGEAEIAAAFEGILKGGGVDYVGAYQTLIDGGEGTAAWVKGHVTPVRRSGAAMGKLIEDLRGPDEQLKEREAAHLALLEMGISAEPLLRDARRECGGEQRLRIDWVLATLGSKPLEEAGRRVALATRVLEVIGTKEAMGVRRGLVAE